MYATQLSLDLGKKFAPIQFPDANKLLDQADYIILAFSSGKDSLACLLELIRLGHKDKLELHHHLIDGWTDHFFDWAITKSYTQKIADYFQVPLYYSYRQGGMRRELLKNNQPSAPIFFQHPDYSWGISWGKQKINTMLKFPMPTANLRVRWCSSFLKITCMDASIRHQPRFLNKKICVITGERAAESKSRAKYDPILYHNTNCLSRTVHQIRLVLDWSTKKVWQTIRQAGIIPHPCYYLNFSRCSCRACIFLKNDDLARLQVIDPKIISEITNYETKFDSTISYSQQRTKKNLPQLNTAEKASLGKAGYLDPDWMAIANSKTWNLPIYVDPQDWQLPIGAYSKLDSGPS